jgi:TM2 domain-containing membrane protein YozV
VDPVSTPEPVRIGNSEREAAVRALGEHFAEGRLDPEEYEERAAAAYAARTADDLAPLFKDLPRGDQSAPVAAPPPGPYPVPAHPTTAYPPAVHPTAGYPAPVGFRDPDAPFGREPATGIPFSDRQKVVAGVLQLVLPCGIGRLYTGHVGMGVAQLLLSPILIGVIWAWIDGIVILAGRPLDRDGRPLRP